MTFLHSKIIRLVETRSTNDYCEQLADVERLPEGSMVVAGKQTNGKGQENNIWESQAGKNLTFTVVLYPDFLKPERQFQLTMVVSLSVCRLLDQLSLPHQAMIKWPNDIYLDHLKVAGILIKNNISGSTLSRSVAGIGLNVNQLKFSEKAPNAVSLAMIMGKEFSLDDLLTIWHAYLEELYSLLKSGNVPEIEQAYLSRFYRLDEWANFTILGEKLRAKITGIGEYGMLQLTAEDGRKFSCGMKEVVFEN